MSPIREQLTKLATDFISAFNTLTPEGFIAYRSSDCKHHILPVSDKNPVRSNEEYQALMLPTVPFIQGFRIQLAEDLPIIVDEEARTVVIYLTSDGETAVGPYNGSYVFTLKANEQGTKIKEIVEFVDSETTNDFTTRLFKYISDVAGGQNKEAA